MDAINDLLTNILSFVTYFAPGYIFFAFYNFSSSSPREDQIEHLIFKSLSASFILVAISNAVSIKSSIPASIIPIIPLAGAACFGLLFGRICRTKWVMGIITSLFQRKASNDFFISLWEEVTSHQDKKVVCVRLRLKEDECVYEGQIGSITQYQRNPMMLLAYYRCYDKDNGIVDDFSHNENARLFVDFATVQKLELIYVTIKDQGENVL